MIFDETQSLELEDCLNLIINHENWEAIFKKVFGNKESFLENFNRIIILKQKLDNDTISREDLNEYSINIHAIRKLFSEKQNIFISYSTKDTKHYKIAEISNRLEKYSKIANAFFWEEKSKENIVEYMERILNISQIFILFCSENASASKAVSDEWHAAFQMSKKGLIKIIPVYEDEIYIPKLLMPLLNVKFSGDNLDVFVDNLYKEILR